MLQENDQHTLLKIEVKEEKNDWTLCILIFQI